jgi:hypothetical protein
VGGAERVGGRASRPSPSNGEKIRTFGSWSKAQDACDLLTPPILRIARTGEDARSPLMRMSLLGILQLGDDLSHRGHIVEIRKVGVAGEGVSLPALD